MGNDLTTTSRVVTTPEGRLALHQTMCSAAMQALSTDEGQSRRLLSPTTVALLPTALVEARAALAPALGADFKRTVSPTLALVAPSGMSEGDHRAWLATAAETLSGMPADLLERGCIAARRKVDHPAKIVPAIFAEVERAWNARRGDAAKIQRLLDLSREPAPEMIELASAENMAALSRSMAGRAENAEREPRRAATVDDYIELGLTTDEARAALAEHEHLTARGSAQQLSAAA